MRTLSNFFGWRTDRKIICLECDDWGSIRISCKESRNFLLSKGIRLDANYFTTYDTLESEIDLEMLFDLISGFRDSKGDFPVINTVNIMGNPDFAKIKNNGFSQYYWQPLHLTYREYSYDSDRMEEKWREGQLKHYVYPTFHGREHLHINRWMKGLQFGFPVTALAFNERITGIHPELAGEKRREYQASFDAECQDDIALMRTTIVEGLDAFEAFFGRRSRYFVPANGYFPPQLLPILKKNGIDYVCSPKIGKYPTGLGNYRRYFRYLGKKTTEGIHYITRNAAFEPSNTVHGEDWVNKCMLQIRNAFAMKKPAVVGMHRVNFVGGIDEANRHNGLVQLKALLSKILSTWPEVEFLTTESLGDLISGQPKLR
jgi:hypothetical protein